MTAHDPKAAKVEVFFAEHGNTLTHQGAVLKSWRYKGGQKFGPYYRLDVETAGQSASLYLGREGPMVAAVRARLAQLQRPRRRRLEYEKSMETLRKGLRPALAKLDQQLGLRGLRRKGYEIRGFARLRAARTESFLTDQE